MVACMVKKLWQEMPFQHRANIRGVGIGCILLRVVQADPANMQGAQAGTVPHVSKLRSARLWLHCHMAGGIRGKFVDFDLSRPSEANRRIAGGTVCPYKALRITCLWTCIGASCLSLCHTLDPSLSSSRRSIPSTAAVHL